MGCKGSKEKKKEGGQKPEPGSKTIGIVPPEQENLKSLKNLNADKPALESVGARKAKQTSTMKGFDDSDEEEKSTTTPVKPGVGPKGKPPPVGSAPVVAAPSGPSKASQMAAQQAELAAMFAAKAEKARKAEEAEEAKKNPQNDDCNVDQFGESHPDQGNKIEEGKEEEMEIINENESANDDASDAGTVLAKNHGSHIQQDRNSLLKSNMSRGVSALGDTKKDFDDPVSPLIVQESDDILVGQTRPGAQSEFSLRPSNPFPIADGAGENRN